MIQTPGHGALVLDYATLRSLLGEHGDSFYVLDTARYLRNLSDLLARFRRRYPKTAVGHSYKTNYIPHLCAVSHAAGSYAEVVSRMEYDLATRLGIAQDRIILNGPVKDDPLLREGLHSGVRLNLDSLQELDRTIRIARESPRDSFGVGLRVNFTMPGLARSRFGIDAESDDLQHAVDLLTREPNLRLEGLHCHIGGDRSANSYAYRAARLIELARQCFGRETPRYLDIGGGFAGHVAPELAAQFPYVVPDMESYAEATAAPFADAFGTGDGPELIVEPGTGLLADVLQFVCEVVSLKRIGDRAHAVTTGSVYNVKPTLNRYDIPVSVIPQHAGAGEESAWTLGGYTCMEVDVLHHAFHGRLATGDILLFSNVGAYTVVLTPPFIKPAPAILAITEGGEIEKVRRAETLDDVLTTYETRNVPHVRGRARRPRARRR